MRTVSGNRVALREAPSTDYPIIDRFDRGRRVQQLETQGEWSRVRDQITQREGWMASRFLPKQQDGVIKRPAKATPKPKEVSRSLPVLSTSMIVQRIIAESISAYPGSCPCPFNTDRGGRRCGKRSAYSKPGGYAPICFPQDVTKAMVAAFRERR
ncbi:MAG: SH3 domain-containing protein [Hoeflea sp.]|uniref:SH3 domain-containing protein n=1 Tax=Hoeflea sp. TaxID=1940281 RepID=UPI003299FDED